MRSIPILLLFICSLCGLAVAQKKNTIEERLEGVDKELTKVLKTWDAAGFAVAVVEKNKIVYAKGFGFRDYENKLPVTPQTLFAIGSCSKSFTTSLLGILREEGKLKLTDSPRDYIPELKFNTNELNNLVTIKDMMSHRTGLPRHDLSWYWFSTYSKDSLIKRIQYQPPFAEVREKWYYNNFMYLAQGVIAERITGKTWEENVREKLFVPLQMSTSNLSIDELEKSNEPAIGYRVSDGKIEKMDYYHIAGMAPAGSINSSVSEMGNWVITWINGGKFQGKQIVPKDFVKEAMSSQMVVNSGIPDKEFPELHLSNYGYGWFLSSYKGHFRVEHGGNINGFSASTSFYPTDSVGIIVLANQNGSSVPGVVRNIISDRILKAEKTNWDKLLKKRREEAIKKQKRAKKDEEENTNTGLPSHGIANYSGDYFHPGYGNIKVVEKAGDLFAELPQYNYLLHHVRFDVFELYEVKDGEDPDTSEDGIMTFNFQTNTKGEISGLDVKIEVAIDPITFNRIVPKD